jgi:TRAP-type C4-dicarboxylate transport system permease small subunit
MGGETHASEAMKPRGRVERAAQAALGLALLFIVAVNVANAVGRHLFGAGLIGADELMVFVMIWIVFAGAVLALAAREHIAIDLLPARLPPRGRAALYCAHDLVTLGVCAYAARASWLYVGSISALGMKSMALGIPLSLPHAAVLAGFAGLAAVAARALLRDALLAASPLTLERPIT